MAKAQTNWIQVGMIVLVVAAVVFGITFVVKFIKSITGAVSTVFGGGPALEQRKEELAALPNGDAACAGFGEEYAKYLADQLEDAMAFWGTDEDKLFGVVEPLNNDGLLLVFHAFGIRPYGPFGIEPLNLHQWFDRELGGTDLERMRSIWASSSIPMP